MESSILDALFEYHEHFYKQMTVQQYAQIIQVKSECLEEYKRIHDPIPDSIAAAIRASNISDYSIFHDARTNVLFATFKYTGTDMDADMAKMRRDEATREWWKVTDAMQVSFNASSRGSTDATNAWWTPIPRVFHQE